MTLPPPRKRLGQHFLTDPGKIEEIVSAIGPSDTLVEIGPGHGALTFLLARQTKHLVAIEKDPDLAAYLERQFADDPGVTVRCADALYEDLSVYPENLRLAGNLPYNIATALLQRWMELRTHLSDLTVMVQREVAQRLAAAPGDPSRGQLSVVVQLLMQVELLLEIEPECFEPPPKVVSTVVRLVPKESLSIGENERKDFMHLVRQAFASRRKTLRNNLAGIPDLVWRKAEIDSWRRAESLSGEEFVRLFQTLGAAL